MMLLMMTLIQHGTSKLTNYKLSPKSHEIEAKSF